MLLCVRHIETDIKAALRGGIAVNIGGLWVKAVPKGLSEMAAANDPPPMLARQLPLFLVPIPSQNNAAADESSAK